MVKNRESSELQISKRFQVTIEQTGEQFDCIRQQSVLEAIEKLGRKGIPVGCRGGGCGVCKVQVVSGSYIARKMSREHISAKEERLGFALACRLVPTSHLGLRLCETTEIAMR